MDKINLADKIPAALFDFWNKIDLYLDENDLDAVHDGAKIYHMAEEFAKKRFPELFL